MVAKPGLLIKLLMCALIKLFFFMCLIQVNNLCVFFKFRLLSWSLFNLQMYKHMYKFKPSFPIFFIWNNSQLLFLVNKNVGTCTYTLYLRPKAS